MKRTALLFCCLILAASLAFSEEAKKEEKPAVNSTQSKMEKMEAKADSTAKEKSSMPKMTTTESGLKYADLVVGKGKEAVNGMKVQCDYTVWIANEKGEKGKMIQSSKDSGKPLSFDVGNPGLIKGWNEGMLGMKEGGTRMLYVPTNLAWGATPPPGIPKNADVIFEITFIKAM